MLFRSLTILGALFVSVTSGFFLSSPTDLPSTPVLCYTGEYIQVGSASAAVRSGVGVSKQSNTRVCAFQEDTGIWNRSNFLRRTYMANTTADILRQIVRTRCQGFSNNSDLGYGSCIPRPFELYNKTTLCICATDFCNRDLTTCQQAVTGPTSLQPNSPPVFPVLTAPITCYDNTQFSDYMNNYVERNLSYVCANLPYYLRTVGQLPTKLIDQAMCDNYTQTNTVLCGIDASLRYTVECKNSCRYIYTSS